MYMGGIYVCVCMFVYMYIVCVYVCMYVDLYMYLHGLCVCICMYVCTYVFDKAVPQSIHIAQKSHCFYFLYPIMVTVFWYPVLCD